MLIARGSGMIVASSPGAQNGGTSRRFRPLVIYTASPASLGVNIERANLSSGTPPFKYRGLKFTPSACSLMGIGVMV